MNSHISARTGPKIATAIAAVCFGVMAVPHLAAGAAASPVVTAAAASPASSDGTPWG